MDALLVGVPPDFTGKIDIEAIVDDVRPEPLRELNLVLSAGHGEDLGPGTPGYLDRRGSHTAGRPGDEGHALA